MVEEHRKQIEKLQENGLIHQREIERLIEERDQARDLLSQSKDEESSYQLQLQERDKQLAQLHEQLQQHENFLSHSYPLNDIESQTTLDVERY
jgi:septal ring factor EnvC (AmiA/AmiB activator)